LPKKSKIRMIDKELIFAVPVDAGAFSVRLIIDGSQSVIYGKQVAPFMSTLNVYLNGSDFITRTEESFTDVEQRRLSGSTDSALSIFNLTFVNFGISHRKDCRIA
jgi:hypothetical protein